MPFRFSKTILGIWMTAFLFMEKPSENLYSQFSADLENDGHPEQIFLKYNANVPRLEITICKADKCYYQGQTPAWRVEKGDIDGDGLTELAFGLYAYEAKDHKVANRLYLYKWKHEKLVDLWRGTALGWPFLDFCVTDTYSDGAARIIALEKSPYGPKDFCRLVTYHWSGFGLAGENVIPVSCDEWLAKGRWVRDKNGKPIYPLQPVLKPDNIPSKWTGKEEK